MNRPCRMHRREFLVTTTLAAVATSASPLAFADDRQKEKTVFEIGMQTFTYRQFTPAQTQEKALALGVKALEYYPGHYPKETKPEEIARLAKEAGIRIPSYGVCAFRDNPNDYKATFEFAKAAGIGVLTADPHPEPDCLDVLESHIKDSDIKVAIHNHGPGSRYETIEDIKRVVGNRDERFGICIDSGHFLRSKVDPAEAAKAFKGRIHGVHLKDIRSHDDHTDVVFGQGLLDVGAFLNALDEAGYEGPLMIEYEAEPDDPTDSVKKCIEYLTSTFPKQVKLG